MSVQKIDIESIKKIKGNKPQSKEKIDKKIQSINESPDKINMLAVMVEDELHIDIEINTSSRLVVIYSE